MRLIDADALRRALITSLDATMYLHAVAPALDAAPTVECASCRHRDTCSQQLVWEDRVSLQRAAVEGCDRWEATT